MELRIDTSCTEQFIDITKKIQEMISIKEGYCIIYCPHTTAGLTINEGADPAVKKDILSALDALIPKMKFEHAEGNSPAHIKSSLMGSSLVIFIHRSRLELGRWQSIYFAEFDGPRQRGLLIQQVGAQQSAIN